MGVLDGRIALVTGSTRGIGRAIAERFAAEGATVVVNGRKQADAESVAAHIPGSVALGADQADHDQIRAMCRRVADEVGPVDVLVNNAAVAPRSAITRVTDEEWEETILVNLTAPFRFIREVVPGMKVLGRGAILNVTSEAGISGTPGFSSYAASKGGLNGLSFTLARELERFGIRTNLLAAAADTDMMRQLPRELHDPDDNTLPPVEANAATALRLVADDTLNGRCLRVGDERDLPPFPR